MPPTASAMVPAAPALVPTAAAFTSALSTPAAHAPAAPPPVPSTAPAAPPPVPPVQSGAQSESAPTSAQPPPLTPAEQQLQQQELQRRHEEEQQQKLRNALVQLASRLTWSKECPQFDVLADPRRSLVRGLYFVMRIFTMSCCRIAAAGSRRGTMGSTRHVLLQQGLWNKQLHI
jgi:hypothetical protein